jgi:iron complex outermembrane receptor protein
MKKLTKRLTGMAVVAIFLIGGSPVVKADHEGADSSKLGEEHQLGAMTVTAQKTEENVQDVPMPITTFDEITIGDADIEDADDVVEFVPNMVLNESYMKGYHETNFRGISLSQFTMKNPVVIFLDGIALDHYANYNVDI